MAQASRGLGKADVILLSLQVNEEHASWVGGPNSLSQSSQKRSLGLFVMGERWKLCDWTSKNKPGRKEDRILNANSVLYRPSTGHYKCFSDSMKWGRITYGTNRPWIIHKWWAEIWIQMFDFSSELFCKILWLPSGYLGTWRLWMTCQILKRKH